jgi:hypothetical protein
MSKNQTVDFAALFSALRELDEARQKRLSAIGEKWNVWMRAASASGHLVETVPPTEISQAAAAVEAKHDRARQDLHCRHESVIRHELEMRLERIRPQYEALAAEMESLAQFEADARRFARACDVPSTPSLADSNVAGLNFSNWSVRVDHVLRPRPEPTPRTSIDVAARLNEILADVGVVS